MTNNTPNQWDLPTGELVRELCEVMDRQRRVALEVVNGGIDVGKIERMGRLATQAAYLRERILGEPWVSVTVDKGGNWVLRDGLKEAKP